MKHGYFIKYISVIPDSKNSHIAIVITINNNDRILRVESLRRSAIGACQHHTFGIALSKNDLGTVLIGAEMEEVER